MRLKETASILGIPAMTKRPLSQLSLQLTTVGDGLHKEAVGEEERSYHEGIPPITVTGCWMNTTIM